MTDEQCERCKWKDWVDGFPEGDVLFVCQKDDDPRMPFDMEHDTPCPLFEEEEE